MAKPRRRRFAPLELPEHTWSTLQAVAEQAGLSPRGGMPLAQAVRVASQLYTGQRADIPGQAADPDMLAARLLFYLVRDFAKVQAPLDALWGEGFRPPGAGPGLRVLDLGAGVGASTLGAARFAARHGIAALEVTALDTQAAALEVAQRVLGRLCDGGWAAPVRLTCRVGSAARAQELAGGGHDVVIASFVLNEMLLDEPPSDRAARGAELLRRWAGCLAPGGALVVLEPALKAESRTLSAVRDALLAGGDDALALVAPCLHGGPCPMLHGDRDWCHQELPLALPAPFDAIAREAGLRWEGLSFSYLTLVRPGGKWTGAEARAASLEPRGALRLRVVSEPLLSKGKRELLGCGEDGALVRLTRLERSDSEANEAFVDLRRGDVCAIEGAVEKGRGLRIEPDTRVDRLGGLRD